MQLEFTVPGRPIPAVRMTHMGRRSKRTMRYMAYRNQIGWIARQHMQGRPTKKSVAVEVKVYLHGGNQGDVDNYFKTVADGLNKIVYEDDRQIMLMKSMKIECAKDDERI